MFDRKEGKDYWITLRVEETLPNGVTETRTHDYRSANADSIIGYVVRMLKEER